jgi:hypothetical protein
MEDNALIVAPAHLPAEPLRKRVPLHDVDGALLGDFMMLIPGLRSRPQAEIRQRLAGISAVCSQYREMIVLAEVNLRLNLLWISHRHRFGIGPEMVQAFQSCVPEALLVGWGPGGAAR